MRSEKQNSDPLAVVQKRKKAQGENELEAGVFVWHQSNHTMLAKALNGSVMQTPFLNASVLNELELNATMNAERKANAACSVYMATSLGWGGTNPLAICEEGILSSSSSSSHSVMYGARFSTEIYNR
jgi:hypothetical protein